MCMPGAHESQKRVLEARELKLLYMVVIWALGLEPGTSGIVVSALY